MNLAKSYGKLVKKRLNKPQSALSLIQLAASLELMRWSKFPDKTIPPSFRYLYKTMFQYILEPMQNSGKSAFVNLFAPCEILHAFKIYPLFIEAMSNFLAGLYCEDTFIDLAENIGISETLCSYHKTFLGAAEKEILPKLQFSVTTTMICDANINTFKRISEKQNIPCYILDIPYEYNQDTEQYVKEQLIEMTNMIEEITHTKFDLDQLREVLTLENETKKYIKDSLSLLSTRHYPSLITLEMAKLMLTHSGIGRKESLDFFKMYHQELTNAPAKKGPSVLWVHTIPTYEETIRQLFNLSPEYNFLGMDINYDYMEMLDVNDPFKAIARKLLKNAYNGDISYRINSLLKLIEMTKTDGVINLCQWGCKQSIGTIHLLKEALKNKNIPYLPIDGDGADRRNTPSGQIRTRVEAFLEILNTQYKEKKNDWLCV
ncbi:MAG: 2-hydroxyacyl-CoA dehydratase family protein [Peptostreptococcales bacterium]